MVESLIRSQKTYMKLTIQPVTPLDILCFVFPQHATDIHQWVILSYYNCSWRHKVISAYTAD